MSTTRLVCLAVLSALVMWAAATAPAVARDTLRNAAVTVSLNRAQVSTRLGGSFDFSSRIKNVSTRPLSGLVAHLNVVGLSEDIYVDPEDWSEDRTKRIASLGAGETTDITWSVKAVTGGQAAIYVVVLPGRNPATAGERPVASQALDVRITERRTLNSGGVLPLAVGVPAMIGAAALAARLRRNRS
jgi:hypothetical protein